MPPRRSRHWIGPNLVDVVVGAMRLVQPLVRPFFVIMSHERVDGCPEMRLAEWHDAVQALGLEDKTNRSANAFKFGLRAGSRGGFTPLSRSSRRNAVE